MKRQIFFLFAVVLFISCSQNSPQEAPVEPGTEVAGETPAAVERPLPDVIGMIKPMQLTGIETTMILEDIFTETSKVSGVEVGPGLEAVLAEDKSVVTIRIIGDVGRYENLRFTVGADQYDQLLITPSKKPVTFRLRDASYKKVAVKGEMNAWNTNLGQMELRNGVWEIDFSLTAGDYQYIFVVDGEEMMDPKNPLKAANGIGGQNSLLSLKQPDQNRLPLLSTVSAEPGKLVVGLKNQGAILAYWNNQLLEATRSDGGFVLEIPEEALELDRSFIRVYSQNEVGVGNDLLIPLEQRQVVQDASRLSRDDKEAQIMYFVLVDRFFNGNAGNDQPVNDDRVLPMANFQGGDLQGITQKIEDGYFESLNINSIWLSPITQNPEGAYQEYPEPRRWYSGYHGYWPILSSKVDHRFGDDASMTQMVSSAHEAGINMLLDYVCNHVHQEHPIYQNNPDWATQLELENGEMNIRIWEEERLTTWFDTFLPSLDLSDEDVIQAQVDSTMFWIEKYGLDGFRHDATKHIPIEFWRELTRRLKLEVMGPQGRSIYQIGETYGSRELTASYIGTGLLDSQFDFNMYFTARESFARPETSFAPLESAMRETFNYFGYHNSMGYISGNHDIPRFISLAGGDLAFGEDDRKAGFEREVGVGDPVGYQRLAMMHAFNFSIPGVPVIFYGDEIGLAGAGDPDNRRMMRFDNLSEAEANLKATVEKITELRSRSMALIYGETSVEEATESTMVISRTYFDQQAFTVFNKSDREQIIEIILPERFRNTSFTVNFNGQLEHDDGVLRVVLPAHSFDIILN